MEWLKSVILTIFPKWLGWPCPDRTRQKKVIITVQHAFLIFFKYKFREGRHQACIIDGLYDGKCGAGGYAGIKITCSSKSTRGRLFRNLGPHD